MTYELVVDERPFGQIHWNSSTAWKNYLANFSPEELSTRYIDNMLKKDHNATLIYIDTKYVLHFETNEDKLEFILRWS